MKQVPAIYPGTFDVFTYGHLDIVQRAVSVFDTLVVAVAPSHPKNPLFSPPERVSMIQEATKNIEGIRVEVFDGLLVDFVKHVGAKVIIRGLRAVTDFEYELQLAIGNRELLPEAETILLVPSSQYSFISSSFVKEIARYGGDISAFVPENVARDVYRRLKERPL